jgi:hypothetical protein
MTTDDADRLAELERENETLRAEIARLKPPPPEPARIDGPFRMPTPLQMERLIAAVLIRYPSLRDPRIADDEFRQMTTSAFRFLSGLQRTPGRLDSQHDLLTWFAYATDALQAIGQPCKSLRGSSLHVAAIGAGDIPFLPPRLFPQCGFGICRLGVMRDTRAPTNRWLKVLEHCFCGRAAAAAAVAQW